MPGVRCDYCGELLFDDAAIQFTEFILRAHPQMPLTTVNGVSHATPEEWERHTLRVHWPRCFLLMYAEEDPGFRREMKRTLDDEF